MIFCEMKLCYCTENTLCVVFLHSCSHAKLQKLPGLQPLKVTYSVLSAFLLFHLVTKGTLAENSLDRRLAKLATAAASRARDVTSLAEYSNFGTAVKRPAFNCFRWLKQCHLNPTVSDLDLACLEPIAPHVGFFACRCRFEAPSFFIVASKKKNWLPILTCVANFVRATNRSSGFRPTNLQLAAVTSCFFFTTRGRRLFFFICYFLKKLNLFRLKAKCALSLKATVSVHSFRLVLSSLYQLINYTSAKFYCCILHAKNVSKKNPRKACSLWNVRLSSPDTPVVAAVPGQKKKQTELAPQHRYTKQEIAEACFDIPVPIKSNCDYLAASFPVWQTCLSPQESQITSRWINSFIPSETRRLSRELSAHKSPSLLLPPLTDQPFKLYLNNRVCVFAAPWATGFFFLSFFL